jgi:hypothetical protein
MEQLTMFALGECRQTAVEQLTRFDPSLQIGALGFRSAHGSLTPISLAAFSCFDDSVESQPPSVAMYG